MLASGHVIHEVEDVDDVEAWRAEIPDGNTWLIQEVTERAPGR